MVNGFKSERRMRDGENPYRIYVSGRISDEAVTRTFRPDLLGSGFQTDPSIKHSNVQGGYPCCSWEWESQEVAHAEIMVPDCSRSEGGFATFVVIPFLLFYRLLRRPR